MGIQIKDNQADGDASDAQAIFEAIGSEYRGLGVMDRLGFANDIRNGTAWHSLPEKRRAVWRRVAAELLEDLP